MNKMKIEKYIKYAESHGWHGGDFATREHKKYINSLSAEERKVWQDYLAFRRKRSDKQSKVRHKERIAARAIEYRRTHRNSMRAANRRCYYRHRQQRLAYYHRNKERLGIPEYQKKYYREHKEELSKKARHKYQGEKASFYILDPTRGSKKAKTAKWKKMLLEMGEDIDKYITK